MEPSDTGNEQWEWERWSLVTFSLDKLIKPKRKRTDCVTSSGIFQFALVVHKQLKREGERAEEGLYIYSPLRTFLRRDECLISKWRRGREREGERKIRWRKKRHKETMHMNEPAASTTTVGRTMEEAAGGMWNREKRKRERACTSSTQAWICCIFLLPSLTRTLSSSSSSSSSAAAAAAALMYTYPY